jgi:hypothetical protein
MARFKLTAPHYIDGKYLEADVLVGEGTDNPLPEDYPPTPYMEAIFAETPQALEEAKTKVKKAKDRAAAASIDNLPVTVGGEK